MTTSSPFARKIINAFGDLMVYNTETLLNGWLRTGEVAVAPEMLGSRNSTSSMLCSGCRSTP